MPEARVVHDTPFCRVVLRDSPRTIIAFSSIGYPPGKFGGSRALEHADCNVVFVNCPDNQWYILGIPGLGDTPGSAADALLALLGDHGLSTDQCLTWGSSMGGYGAVLYGALLNVAVVVASGAVLKLFSPGSYSASLPERYPDDLHVPDIRETVAAAPGRFFLHAGEFCYRDLVSARMVMDLPNVSVTTLADFNHWLATYLNGRYGLPRFLTHHFDHDAGFAFEDGEVGGLTEWSDHWRALDLASQGWTEPLCSELLALAARTTDADFKMHCRNALSRAAMKTGLHRRAVNQAEKALVTVPHSRHAARRLVLAMKRAGAPSLEWLEIATRIRDLNRPHVFEPAMHLLETMAQAYAESGRVREGTDFLNRLIALPDTAPEMRDWLEGLSKRLSASRAWRISVTPEAVELFPLISLDETLVHLFDGQGRITGMMLLPRDWKNPPDLAGQDLTILRGLTGLSSPKLADRFPDHPFAAVSRFKIHFRIDDLDSATLFAKERDGGSFPLIRFMCVQSTG